MAARILFLDHTATLGGGELALLNLVTHLERECFDPTVLLCSEGKLHAALVGCGINTDVLPLAPSIVHVRKDTLSRSTLLRVRDGGRLIQYVIRLARYIRKNRFDLVHTNSLKADVIGGLAARLARTPVVWHVRDRIDDDYLPPKVARLFRYMCRVVPDYVIANSNATMATLGLGEMERVRTVYSGIDIGAYPAAAPPERPGAMRAARVVHDGVRQFTGLPAAMAPKTEPAPASASAWYQKLGRGACVGLVGRISPWKGQHIFIRACAEIRDRFPRATFKIIGAPLFAEAAYDSEIRQLVRDLEMDDRIEFTGFRDDIQTAISELDILVHASTTGEPFGQVVAEGMAAGKPVIATCGGGIPEIVQNGVTGLLVPMGDHVAMAAALSYLMDNPEEALEMGVAGKERAAAYFDIDRTARNVECIYEEILGRRKRAR